VVQNLHELLSEFVGALNRSIPDEGGAVEVIAFEAVAGQPETIDGRFSRITRRISSGWSTVSAPGLWREATLFSSPKTVI